VTAAALLRVAGLTVAYGARPVVDGISFDVDRGRCLGIIGESGSGKTQACLALLDLLTPSARVTGSAQLGASQLIGGGARAVRGRRVAMVFQDPMTALTPHLSVGDQIAEPLVAHRGMSWRSARAAAVRLLEQVRIADAPRRAGQFPHELSGGMRQRVTIAMALACEPELLIADEPTSALDVSVQSGILSLLRQLIGERAMALAVITHDMGVIAALADDVLVMRHGAVVERGAVDGVMRTPRHEYTQALLAATPRLDAPLPNLGRSLQAGEPPLTARRVTVTHRLALGAFRARELTAVEDVSLTVAPGEALGIVGESGSGKSSLSRALLRLGAARGEIVWLGRAVHALSGEALRRVRDRAQIVFQDPFASLDPTMTIAEVVAEPLRALRPSLGGPERAEQVARMLASVGLDATFLGRSSSELSGGQNQRVAIARAMVLAPKLLVCDEAVSALDVSIQAQILKLLQTIRREQGTSIVFVSHNLAVVRELCDRALVMYQGRVVESGPVADLFAAPRHPYTRLLLDSVPRLDPASERARLAAFVAGGDVPSAFDRTTGCVFRARCPAALATCAQHRPELEAVGESHEVACFRWHELVKQA
jgi:oligopeptide/dipeptide ABC transporter ATP-binding protein